MDNSVPHHIELLLTSIAQKNGISRPRLELSTCGGAGDNYVGKVYRVLINDELEEREMHLVLKTPPGSKQRRELLRVGIFFRNEAHVYENILPAFADCYRRRGHLDKNASFLNAPRAYAWALSNDENDVIVLEDMRPRGFVMADRRLGLDAVHCRLVLTELARLHAASLALQATDPHLHDTLVGQLTENVFVQPKEGDDASIKSFCERIRGLIKERFPEGTKERSKFEEFAEDFGTRMRSFLRKDSKLSVITHGDTWINNLLFKYNKESSSPVELSLIDFQVSRYASPVLDLSYFLYTSTTKTLRDKHYDEFMRSYHRDLANFLQQLGVNFEDVAPWDLFEQELKKFAAYGWGMAMLVVPLFLADKNDLVGVDDDIKVETPEKMFLKNSTNDNTQLEERMSDILEDVVRLGYL